LPTLDWIGKKAVENHDKEIPYRLIKCVETVGDKDAGNLVVQGDNLEALKALLPYYAGRVKCIYIDPPYNTGEEKWVYNDNVNSPEIRAWLHKVVGREGEDLSRHDKWLCMMYPRLKLLRDFLRDDGVIFVSIDDNEQANLNFLMKEIFGSNNFIGSFVWEGALKNDSKFISVSHDYIFCYARSKFQLKVNNTQWRSVKEGIDKIYATVDKLLKTYDNDYEKTTDALKEWYSQLKKNDPAWQHRHYNKVDKKGVYFPSDISWPGGGGPIYDVLHPVTKKPVKKPARGWVYPQKDTLLDMIKKDKVEFGKDENKVPTLKRYLNETEGAVLASVIYKDRRAAMQRLRLILGEESFENPKDEEILMKIIEATTLPGDLVLDSFAGSGSTAHAILELNRLNKETEDRLFILIEMDENIALTRTSKRVEKIIRGYAAQRDGNGRELIEGLGGGFRYCVLWEPMFDELGNIRSDVKFNDLAHHVFFSETGVPLEKKPKNALIGEYKGVGYYLLFNGIIGDKSINGGNILTSKVLEKLPAYNGDKVIFGEGCRLSGSRLRKENITFKQIPYEIKVS
jgi:adenine-specific DNA-methyltransferase